MSTGLKTFYSGVVPFGGGLQDTTGAGGNSACLIFKADRDFILTHVVLTNMSGSPADARIAIKAGAPGTGIVVPTAPGDGTRVATFTAIPTGKIIDWATRVPLRPGFGLIAISSVGLADAIVWGGFTGEQLD